MGQDRPALLRPHCLKAQAHRVKLDFGDPAIFHRPSCHDRTPYILHDSVAGGTVLAAFTHIGAYRHIQRQMFVVHSVIRLQAYRFGLKNKVAQAV